MNTRTVAMGVTIASVVCLGSTKLALASGNAVAIRSCTSAENTTSSVPGSYQAFLYSWEDYNNSHPGAGCWVLEYRPPSGLFPPDLNKWAGYDVSEGFPNDDIRSLKTGSSVYIILFRDSFGTASHGATLGWGNGVNVTSLGTTWIDSASAARLVYGFPGSVPLWSHGCAAPSSNYITIWDTAGYVENDCTTLDVQASRHYPDPVSMGFRNDTISAVQVSSGRAVYTYNNSNYGSFLFEPVLSCGNISSLSACGYTSDYYSTNNADNKISSIY